MSLADSRAYHDATAEVYDDMHYDVAGSRRCLALIGALARLYNVETVLDVGCGSGRVSEFFRDTGVRVVGLDPAAALLSVAVREGRSDASRLLQASGAALPFADASFDFVCEWGILHHVADPEPVVAEMVRVARRGVFLSDTNRFGSGPTLARVLKLGLWLAHLWPLANRIKTRGRGWVYLEADGNHFSYSVYDSYAQLADWAEQVFFVPSEAPSMRTRWASPLLTSPGVLACALREASQSAG